MVSDMLCYFDLLNKYETTKDLKLRFVYTSDVGLAVLLSDAILIDFLFYKRLAQRNRLCKRSFREKYMIYVL